MLHVCKGGRARARGSCDMGSAQVVGLNDIDNKMYFLHHGEDKKIINHGEDEKNGKTMN